MISLLYNRGAVLLTPFCWLNAYEGTRNYYMGWVVLAILDHFKLQTSWKRANVYIGVHYIHVPVYSQRSLGEFG